MGFTFERSENDYLSFDHFTGVLVDGKLVEESSYTAKRGSLILELKPSFLEGIPVGKHAVTALFNDGSALAAFVVNNKDNGSEAKPSGKMPNTDGALPSAGVSSASRKLPQTGDDEPIFTMVTPCVFGAILLATGLLVRRKGLS
ncbi:MAG: hypothetical protein IJ092_14520 [Atopobiaceae bacterium]|nr:hypothetical protein [Atopobiaceae bacterium]